MQFRKLEILTCLMPPALIGGFEFIRHMYLLPYISMETGNFIITELTLVLSFLYTTWVFRLIRSQNKQLAEEQSRRAVYEERERLARELHDGIAQTVFFLGVKLKQGRIDDARNAVAMIDNQVRQAIFNVRSMPDGDGSLIDRLDRWLEQWSALSGIDVEHRLDKLPEGVLTSAQEVHLFGIIQEAFNNIRKHAHARHAFLSLTLHEADGWQMEIRDDGIGIAPDNLAANRFGITMMTERARDIGATFEIKQHAEGGTVLLLTAPDGRKR
ncbi:MAG: sensor histidine kinase [Tumebacillaceae bacterium]